MADDPTDIATWIDSKSDFELCNAVEGLIQHRLQDRITSGQLPEPARTINHVWSAMGLVEIGGFSRLFECPFSDDEDFRITAQAFETIGATTASEVFREVLDQFPGATVPTDNTKVTQTYSAVPEPIRDDLESRFWAAHDEIVTHLAGFIHGHHEALMRIL